MPKKSQKRRLWTNADVRKLKTLAKRNTTAANIARTLKRTEGATRQKAFSLGLSLDTRARNQAPNLAQPSVDFRYQSQNDLNGHAAKSDMEQGESRTIQRVQGT